MWIHINFWFNKKLSKRDYDYFVRYLAGSIGQDEYTRRFFLFEPYPHCFLAIETNKPELIIFNNKPSFVSRIEKELNTNDKDNGEQFLNIMDNITSLVFMGKKDKTFLHIIHCIANEITHSRKKEMMCYYTLFKSCYREDK